MGVWGANESAHTSRKTVRRGGREHLIVSSEFVPLYPLLGSIHSDNLTVMINRVGNVETTNRRHRPKSDQHNKLIVRTIGWVVTLRVSLSPWSGTVAGLRLQASP